MDINQRKNARCMYMFKYRCIMLWSQIKLTSYDFSDVHVTGEFDNRPGTGGFLGIFSCVVTYRTGAVRYLYIKTSMAYGALPAL